MIHHQGYQLTKLVILLIFSVSCIQFDHDLNDQIRLSQGAQIPSIIIDEVKFLGNLHDSSPDFIQVIGSNLGSVNGGSLTGPGVNEQLFVDSRTENQVSLFANSPLSIGTELIYNLVISNAEAQSAMPITVVIPNDSITENLILDGEIKPDLDLGAPAALAINDGDILKWNMTNNRWEPSFDARSSKLRIINNERNHLKYSKGLDALLQLQPALIIKDEDSEQFNIGFKAEQIKQFLSGQAQTNEANLDLNSELILGSAINAIKELNQKLELKNSKQRLLQSKVLEFQKRNDQLIEEKDQLKAQIDEIRSRLRLLEEHLQ